MQRNENKYQIENPNSINELDCKSSSTIRTNPARRRHLQKILQDRAMKRIFCIIILFIGGFHLQSQNISNMISHSLDSHIHQVYEEKDSIIFSKKKIYVMPFLFYIDKNILPTTLKDSKIVWLTNKRQIRKIRKKKKDEIYRGFFSLNMSLEDNGNIVIYIQNQLKYYIDGAKSRFEYKYYCDSNQYILIKHEYICDADYKIIYEKHVNDKSISSSIYKELLKKHLLSQQTKDKYNDTINIVYYDDKFAFKYTVDMPNSICKKPINKIYHYDFEDFYKTKYENKYLLSIDVSINKKGNVIVFLRDIYCNGKFDYDKKIYPNDLIKEVSYSKFELKYNCKKNNFDIISHEYNEGNVSEEELSK
ncbi:MAG: hypothetical protein WC135_06385 [Bacteroidales bacterium]